MINLFAHYRNKVHYIKNNESGKGREGKETQTQTRTQKQRQTKDSSVGWRDRSLLVTHFFFYLISIFD